MLSNPPPGSETAASSSPPRNAIFSDDAKRSSSPPSSPPCFPWELPDERVQLPKPLPKPRAADAFSILGKRKGIESIGENVHPSKKSKSPSIEPRRAASKPKTLMQMQISLGQEVQKRCSICGMEYVASSAEDRKLHDKYHKQNIEGYDVGKDFVQKARPGTIFKSAVEGDFMCAVDGQDKPARQRRAQDVLEIVQRELGAVEIPSDDIWETSRLQGVSRVGRYTAYLYVRGTKCISFLLVQKIRRAKLVVKPILDEDKNAGHIRAEHEEKENRVAMGSLAALKARREAAAKREEKLLKQPTKLSNTATDAVLGVSRIWTSMHYRQHSIATMMLDIALRHHNEMVEGTEATQGDLRQDKSEWSWTRRKINGKEDVAFSQPTEAGVRLARRWYGMTWGWPVYVD